MYTIRDLSPTAICAVLTTIWTHLLSWFSIHLAVHLSNLYQNLYEMLKTFFLYVLDALEFFQNT